MRANVKQGAFDLYDPSLVPATGIVGTAQAEAGARFRYKNIWSPSNMAAFTYQGIFGANAVLWTTPQQPFLIDYVSFRFLGNMTAVRSAGPSFSTIAMALMLNDNSTYHALIDVSAMTFTGTFSIGSRQSLFSTAVYPGALLSSYNVNTSDQNGAIGAGGRFHAYTSNWYNQPLWLTMISEPTAWTISAQIELTICGEILG